MAKTPFLPDDPDDLDYTRRSTPDYSSRGWVQPDPEDAQAQTPPLPGSARPLPKQPPPGKGHVRARDRRAEKMAKEKREIDPTLSPEDREALAAADRRSRRKVVSRRDSGLFLPAWSVLLMVVAVLGIAAMIIIGVLVVGGGNTPGGDPRVLIITAVPSETPIVTPLPPPEVVQTGVAAGTAPAFVLEGPLLPTVGFTPTPANLSVGSTVRVINVGEARLNVRNGPSTTNTIILQASEGDTFVVIDGPQASENFTWWQLQSASDASITGWAVENDGSQDVLAVQ